eukprot:jgi/Galph1/5482/GphlegSOOS_G4128.1
MSWRWWLISSSILFLAVVISVVHIRKNPLEEQLQTLLKSYDIFFKQPMNRVTRQKLRWDLESRIRFLGNITDNSNASSLNRPFLSTASIKVANHIGSWMEASGCFPVYIDPVGNIGGFYLGTQNSSGTLIIASHYDTVNGAGKYDGIYGVLAAIGVVDVINTLGIVLPFDIQIVAFEDEEGNNEFGTTNMGSKVFVAGSLSKMRKSGNSSSCIQTVQTLLDYQSSSSSFERLSNWILERQKALISSSPSRYIPWRAVESIEEWTKIFCNDYLLASHNEPLGYLECHMEQGPVLERMEIGVGLVDSIIGQKRFRVDIFGESGHAGTVPMHHYRRDALTACADMIMQVETMALDLSRRNDSSFVATVGSIKVMPGSSNVIAGYCSFTVDIRSKLDQVLSCAVEILNRQFSETSKRRNVSAQVHFLYNTTTTRMNEHWHHLLEKAVIFSNHFNSFPILNNIPILVSGAGHDAAILSELCPVNMLFVRCKNGWSHRPEEYISPEDMELGATSILFFLLLLAQRIRNPLVT